MASERVLERDADLQQGAQQGPLTTEEEARQGVGGIARENVPRHQGRWTGAVLARDALSQ